MSNLSLSPPAENNLNIFPSPIPLVLNDRRARHSTSHVFPGVAPAAAGLNSNPPLQAHGQGQYQRPSSWLKGGFGAPPHPDGRSEQENSPPSDLLECMSLLPSQPSSPKLQIAGAESQGSVSRGKHTQRQSVPSQRVEIYTVEKARVENWPREPSQRSRTAGS